jgi:ribosomal protein L7/L12
MTKAELLEGIREMKVQDLIEIGPFLKNLAELTEALGKDLKGNCFNVVLVNLGPYKIEVIKIMREYFSSVGAPYGLKEVKDLVEMPTPVLVANLNEAEATALKDKLTSAGAKIELEIC